MRGFDGFMFVLVIFKLFSCIYVYIYIIQHIILTLSMHAIAAANASLKVEKKAQS
jgi:hypothetical protein